MSTDRTKRAGWIVAWMLGVLVAGLGLADEARADIVVGGNANDNITAALTVLGETYTVDPAFMPDPAVLGLGAGDVVILGHDGGITGYVDYLPFLAAGGHVVLAGGSNFDPYRTWAATYFAITDTASGWHLDGAWTKVGAHPANAYLPATYTFSNLQHTYHMLAFLAAPDTTLLGMNDEGVFVHAFRTFAGGGTFNYMALDIGFRTGDEMEFVVPWLRGALEATATAVQITCPPDQDVECGMPATLTFGVDEASGEAVTVTFSVDGTPVPAQTKVVPAGAVPTTVDFDYTFGGPPGTAYLVEATGTNTSGDTGTCSVTVTAVDSTPPVGTCSVQRAVLWPASGGLLPVGFTAQFNDACDGALAVGTVRVYSDEPNGTAPFTPDALVAGGVRLRAERAYPAPAGGRVYLVVARTTDASGNTGYTCCTAVVPLVPTVFHITQVLMEAAAAQAACEASGTGTPPATFSEVSPLIPQ